ncbi:MAG TPA: alpha/beta fold hydrolase [Acidimicrobiia bacterium]|nr:alpha/beta fold hydrolase [Acidimicrobiia bacterium]
MIDEMADDGTMLLDLDHGIVQVDSVGTGPDLIILHSLLTGPEAFDAVVAALSADVTLHRIHLPGFGASSPLPGNEVTIEGLSDVVASALSKAGLGTDTSVLGNGLGSFVALALAIRHGERFDRLIVSNTGPGFPLDRRAPFTTMSELAIERGMDAVADLAISRIFPAGFIESHPGMLDERRSVLEEIDAGAFAAACRALSKLDLSEGLSEIVNPTLVITGEIDQTTPPEMGAEVAASIPGSRLELIANCGHCPQLEKPDHLASLIEDLLLGRGGVE